MNFEIGRSNKNKDTLIYNGYEFTKKQQTKTTVHWICRYNRQFKCRSTVITCGDLITKYPKEHCCRFVPGETEARKLVSAMKETALYTGNVDAIATSLANVSDNIPVQLSIPKKDLITRTLNRHRRKNAETQPSMPNTRHFDVPSEFTDFLLHDSGKEDNERFLIFGQRSLLELMESLDTLWLADGTFKLCPEIFFQLFTIHITINGYNPPCVYILLPNKTEKTYNRMLDAIKTLIPRAEPTRIMLDFEKAAMNAFQKHYPTSSLSGCFFHLCQSFMRKINDVGLKSVYEGNAELALSLRMIPALSFLPTNEVEEGFDLVVEEVIAEVEKMSLSDELTDKIDAVAAYFQKTYIGHKIGNTYRPPSFPPSIWNQSASALEGLARTNNATEGWHFGLQSLFQGAHPNLWTFLRQIKKDSLVHKFNAIQGLAGAENPTRKRYRLLNERVQKICSNYSPDDKMNFLRAMAHLQ